MQHPGSFQVKIHWSSSRKSSSINLFSDFIDTTLLGSILKIFWRDLVSSTEGCSTSSPTECLDTAIRSYPVKCGSGIHNDGGTIRSDQFNIAYDLWQELAVLAFSENGAAGGGAAGDGAAGSWEQLWKKDWWNLKKVVQLLIFELNCLMSSAVRYTGKTICSGQVSQRWWSLHDPTAIGWHVTGSLQIHSLSLLSLLSFLSLLNSDFERKDLVCTWTKVRESEKITKTRLHDIVERNASHIIVWTWSFAGALACGERELYTSPKLLD